MFTKFKTLSILTTSLTLVASLSMTMTGTAAASPTALYCAPVQSSLSIPNQLESAINLDKVNHTVTLPLYKGDANDDRVWFILTDTSDLNEAVRLGINWSPKLANALD